MQVRNSKSGSIRVLTLNICGGPEWLNLKYFTQFWGGNAAFSFLIYPLMIFLLFGIYYGIIFLLVMLIGFCFFMLPDILFHKSFHPYTCLTTNIAIPFILHATSDFKILSTADYILMMLCFSIWYMWLWNGPYIMMYCLHYLLGFDWYYPERIATLERSIENYDVIFLQEAWCLYSNYSFHTSLKTMAAKKGFIYIGKGAVPSMWRLRAIHSGTVILSRYPVIKSEFIPWSYHPWYDGSWRGVLTAELKIESELNDTQATDRRLTVLNMHLIASSQAIWEKVGWQRDSGQTEQLEQLNGVKSVLASINHEDPTRQVIVAGDFNLTRSEPAYDKMVNIFVSQKIKLRDVSDQNGIWKPTFACRGAGDAPTETFLSHKGCYVNPPRRLDYIFSNGKPTTSAKLVNLKMEKHPEMQQISDHKGIEVTLFWE